MIYFSDVVTPRDAGIVEYGPRATKYCLVTSTTQSFIIVHPERNPWKLSTYYRIPVTHCLNTQATLRGNGPL